MCKSKYSTTRRQTSRDNIKKRKLEEVHTNSEITEENVTKKLKYVHNQLVHPIGSVSALRKEENNCKQSNHKTDENSKKRSLVQNDSVNTQLNKNYNLLPKTKYASVLCINCKYKAPKDICEICKPKYKRARDQASRENIRNRKENIKKNEICSNISDLDNISPIKNKLSEKTIRNKSAKIKDIAKSSTAEILSHVIKKSDPKERQKLTKSLLPDYEDEIKAKMCKKFQKEVGAKSDLSYKLKSQCLNESKNTNDTALMKLYGSGRTKVKKMRTEKVASRKPREKRINLDIISKVVSFYERGDISTVTPNKSKFSIKKGQTRFMRYTFMESYKIFRFENPKIKISYSTFYALKPRKMVALLNTPLLGCFCIYCSNVKLKLAKLNISELSSEYELFNLRVCEKNNK